MTGFVPPLALRAPRAPGTRQSATVRRVRVAAVARNTKRTVPPSDFGEADPKETVPELSNGTSKNATGLNGLEDLSETSPVVEESLGEAAFNPAVAADEDNGAPSPEAAFKKKEEDVVDEKSTVKDDVDSVEPDVMEPVTPAEPKAEEEVEKPAMQADVVTDAETDGLATPAETEEAPVGVKMSEERIAAAADRREAAAQADAADASAAAEKRAALYKRAEATVQLLAEKTGVVTLGMKSRVALEERVDRIVNEEDEAGEGGDESAASSSKAQRKLSRTAGKALRSLGTAIAAQWEARVVPLVRKRLPPEAEGVDSKAIASAAVGAVTAVVLLPALFSGGGQKVDKALEKDTAQLRGRLERSSKPAKPSKTDDATTAAAQKLLDRRARTEERIFPKVEPVPEALQAPKQTPKPMPRPEAPPATVTPPAAVAPQAKVAPPTETPKPAPAKPVEPAKPAEPSQATPSQVRLAAEKAFGSKSSLIAGASFDSLAETPTVAVEVTPAFGRLPLSEQRATALAALQGARALGFETVAVVDAGSGSELARAGIDVSVADERAGLRAELKSTRERAEKLAAAAADAETERDAARTLLLDEREKFAEQRAGEQKELADAHAQAEAVLSELKDAQAEIASTPDRQELELRTQAAEKTAEDMGNAVETLSRQVVVARDAQVAAEAAMSQADVAAKEARAAADVAVKEADARVVSVREEATSAREAVVGRVRAELSAQVEAAEKAQAAAENILSEVKADAAKSLEAANAAAAQELSSVLAASEKAAGIASQEAESSLAQAEKTFAQRLDDLKKEAQARLDSAMGEADKRVAGIRDETKAAVQAAEKREREAVKEAKGATDRVTKELRKVSRERDGLVKQVEKAKAKAGAPVQEAATNAAVEAK